MRTNLAKKFMTFTKCTPIPKNVCQFIKMKLFVFDEKKLNCMNFLQFDKYILNWMNNVSV